MKAVQRPIDDRVQILSGTPAASNSRSSLESSGFACRYAAPSGVRSVPMTTGLSAVARRARALRVAAGENDASAERQRHDRHRHPDARPRRAAPHHERQDGEGHDCGGGERRKRPWRRRRQRRQSPAVEERAQRRSLRAGRRRPPATPAGGARTGGRRSSSRQGRREREDPGAAPSFPRQP